MTKISPTTSSARAPIIKPSRRYRADFLFGTSIMTTTTDTKPKAKKARGKPKGPATAVAEINFGGAMVEAVVRAAAAEAKLRVNFKEVRASRGKVVRAEPVATLYGQGRVHHVGNFPMLEDQLVAFSTHGYLGDGSPDRADALTDGTVPARCSQRCTVREDRGHWQLVVSGAAVVTNKASARCRGARKLSSVEAPQAGWLDGEPTLGLLAGPGPQDHQAPIAPCPEDRIARRQ